MLALKRPHHFGVDRLDQSRASTARVVLDGDLNIRDDGFRLTRPPLVGMIANMPSRLLYTRRLHHDDGGLVEMVIWELPASLPRSAHRYKYRLYYGYPGRRLVGYDNERGKGDHRHLPGKETPYAFVSVDRLIEDFLDDVARSRDHANDDDTDRTR